MIETIGLILALVGIAFAFEAPRNIFLRIFFLGERTKSQAHLQSVVTDQTQLSTTPFPVSGATQSGRHPFFIDEPKSSLKDAIVVSKDTDRPVFLIIYDKAHPSKSKLYYSLGCFMDYYTTKRLVQDHFVVALVSSADKDAASLIPSDDPLENCLLVILDKNGRIIRREGVHANPDEGLKRVRAVISSLPNA